MPVPGYLFANFYRVGAEEVDLENSDDDSEPRCPFCSSESECEHLLLTVDKTFRTALGGKLWEAFNQRWAAHFEGDQADADFNEIAEFDALLEYVDASANYSYEFVIEGGPGMTSAYVSFYVATEAKLKSACAKFDQLK